MPSATSSSSTTVTAISSTPRATRCRSWCSRTSSAFHRISRSNGCSRAEVIYKGEPAIGIPQWSEEVCFRAHRSKGVPARIIRYLCERNGPRGIGGQGRNRTTDTRIFSPLLYQLSYLAVARCGCCPAHIRGRLRPCTGRNLNNSGSHIRARTVGSDFPAQKRVLKSRTRSLFDRRGFCRVRFPLSRTSLMCLQSNDQVGGIARLPISGDLCRGQRRDTIELDRGDTA